MNYAFHVLFLLGVYVTLAVSLDILIGHLGLLVLCHSAFFAVGAYINASLMLSGHMPFAASCPLAIIGTMALSLPVAVAARRLRGDAVVLGSFALLLVTVDLLKNLRQLTGGLDGLRNIPPVQIGRLQLVAPQSQAIVSLLVAAACWCIARRVTSSAQGRFLHALRDDPYAAVGLRAYSTNIYLRSFALASGMAAIAGVLYGSYATYINPTIFGSDQAIALVAMVLLGGAARPWGPVLGAILVLAVPEFVRAFGGGMPDVGAVNYIVMGAVLLLFATFRPKGILGGYEFK